MNTTKRKNIIKKMQKSQITRTQRHKIKKHKIQKSTRYKK